MQRALVATRIRQLREAGDISRQSLADDLDVDVTAVAAWEAGKYMPRVGHRCRLAAVLGTNIGALFGDGECVAPVSSAELFDTMNGLEAILGELLSNTRGCLRALRIAAPYRTPAHVQKAFRQAVSDKLLAGVIEVQRIEVIYELSRLKELLSNICRYDGCRYYVKSYCPGSTEVFPGMGGYFFDDSEFLVGAYWTGVPPHNKPSLKLSGEPFRTFFSEYWNEIWRRGALLNIQGMHDLSAIREVAVKLGLKPREWPSFLDEARCLEIGDGAPPLV
jgi:transcriptional regulator with XRE-family HTH domain